MKVQKIQIVKNPTGRGGEKKKWSPKIYISIERETLVENLVNRRNRPYTEYKKIVLPEVMSRISKENPELFERIKEVKWGWDKHCGCSMCPCSPGFIGDGVHEPTDIFVDVAI